KSSGRRLAHQIAFEIRDRNKRIVKARLYVNDALRHHPALFPLKRLLLASLCLCLCHILLVLFDSDALSHAERPIIPETIPAACPAEISGRTRSGSHSPNLTSCPEPSSWQPSRDADLSVSWRWCACAGLSPEVLAGDEALDSSRYPSAA